MSKSILVSFNGYPQTPSAFLPDNGLASLAACLLEKGHETKIFDYNVPETIKKLYGNNKEEVEEKLRLYAKEIAEQILSESNLDFVGIKLWTGDGFKGSIYVAKEVKRLNPKLPIVVGGPHVDNFREKIFQVTNSFDFLSVGEGEETIAALANCMESKQDISSVPNLIYKKNGIIKKNPEKRVNDLDSLATATYDRSIYPSFDQKVRFIVSEWSRGCPYRCNFCIHPSKSGASVRAKTAEHIVSELQEYKNRYNTSVFLSGDSDTPGRLLEDVAEELIQRQEKITYTAMTHLNHVNEKRLQKMKEAGFVSIFYGMESGSQEILDESIDKKLQVSTIRSSLTATKRTGITVFASVIVPAPGETESTKLETLELLKELRPDYVTVNLPMIGPYSKWYDEASSFGIELAKDYDHKIMFFTPTLLFPPSQWNPFDYKINGKEFRQIAEESGRFCQELEKAGIVTQMSYDLVLMARYAGEEPKTFRNNVKKILVNGDYKEMGKTIENINPHIR